MVSFASSDDVRMNEIKGKITILEGDLEILYGFVDHLPDQYQLAARAALRRAVEVGRGIGDLERLPASPPVDEEGMLVLGPELRHHILETRRVYADIDDLSTTIDEMFSGTSREHLRSILRRERGSNTGTSTTAFDIAA